MTGRHLRLGLDRADITPDRPVPLAGYAARAGLGPASQVSAPLRLRTFAFETGNQRAVFVSADLLWWGTDLVARLRTELGERYGLPPDAVLLHATHTHSGPQVSIRFVPLLGEPDAGYLERVRGIASDSVGRALDSMTEVRVERATGTAPLGVDRRSARSNGAVPPAPIDDELTVVRFVRAETTLALLVHYACHPVVHHGNVVTSDFTGSAMDRLEARDPGLVAAYAQGCCGDVNPDLYDSDCVFQNGDQDAVDRFGARLADAVSDTLAAGATPLDDIGVAADGWTVELPVAQLADPAELRDRAANPGVDGEWARLLLDRPERRTPTVPVRFSRLRLAGGLGLLGLSGEPVSAYGRQVKADSNGTLLPLGYTNGMTGYLVTARQLEEGGYEPAEAPYYFGMPAPLAPEAEPVLRAALRRAVLTSGSEPAEAAESPGPAEPAESAVPPRPSPGTR